MSDEQDVKRGVDPQIARKRKKSKTAPNAAATAAAAAAAPEAKPSPADKKRKSNAIDDIFAARPARSAAHSDQPPQAPHTDAGCGSSKHGSKAAANAPGKRQAVKGSKDDLFDEEPVATRRFDEEGLPIYSTEELNVGKGGGTGACPFDCECCF